MAKLILRRDEVADIVTQYFLSQGLADELQRQIAAVHNDPAAAFAGHEITVPAGYIPSPVEGETDPEEDDDQDNEDGQEEVVTA